MTNLSRTRLLALATGAAALSAVALSGCSDSAATGDDGTVQVLASFYPLQFLAEEIGGDLVTVTSLTPTGSEPHDLELSPAHTRTVGEADLVLYLSSFQPSVDEAIEAREPDHVIDAADSADLVAHELQGAHEDEHEDESEHSTDDGHDHGTLDPHFWLDPTRLAAVSDSVVAELSAIDPDNADVYAQRAKDLVASLNELDESFATGLATCDSRLLVTSHEAFGYLADSYDLEQVGISGIDPEAEPSPARIKDVSAIIRDRNVTTIYFETLVSPKVTQTLASDLNVQAAVLDPLENLSDPSQDYRSVMLSNLDALRTGLGCS